jgi:hypothetical protein
MKINDYLFFDERFSMNGFAMNTVFDELFSMNYRNTYYYYVCISSESSVTWFRWVPYICLVSPLQKYILLPTYVFPVSPLSHDFGDCSVTWFRWVLVGLYMSSESSTELHTTTTYISSDSSVTWFRWVLIGLYMSGESSTELHTATTYVFPVTPCHLISVSPCWIIYVLRVLYGNTTYVCISSSYSSESSLEYICPVSPPWNKYVRWVLLGIYMSGESSLDTYVRWVLLGIYTSGESFTTGMLGIYIQSLQIYTYVEVVCISDEQFLMNRVLDERFSMNMFFNEQFSV